MEQYYVYVWYRTDNDTPFYVGKGKGTRFRQLVNRNRYFLNVYKKHGGYSKILYDNLPEKEAALKEIETIREYRKIYPLTNITDGGEGVSGLVHSQITREKLSMLAKKQWSDPETRSRVRNAILECKDARSAGISRAKRGKKFAPEHKENHKKAMNKSETVLRLAEAKTKYRNIQCTMPGYEDDSIVFYNTRDAVEWLKSIGFNKANMASLINCLTSMRNTYYGFCWIAENQLNEVI
jgi:hypothetical protein